VLDSRLLLSLIAEIENSIEKRPVTEIRNLLSQAHDCAVQVDRKIRVDLAVGRQPHSS
jgi:hypothetical protein